MKIRMLNTAAGPEGSFLAGQVVDVPGSLGRAFIEGGYAVAIEIIIQAKEPEITTIEARERSVLPRGKAKKKK